MIPRELYAVVTEVLVYVYRLEERGARRRGDGNAHGLPAVAIR
jgi:flagellar biosynthesis protein FlhB